MNESSPLRSEAVMALRIAAVTLAVCFVAGAAFEALRSPIALVAVPGAAAAAWLYRGELRAGGWWTVVLVSAVGIGLVLFLVSPSYWNRLLP